jgi:hypothetical protein
MVEQKDIKLPVVNVVAEVPAEIAKNEIVKAEQLIAYSIEILDDIRSDRQELSDKINTFAEMVVNEGEASHSTKEALVNLLKIKSDTADKKTKVMDLLVRIFTRDRSMPGYIAQNVNNLQINHNSKRDLLKTFEEEKKTGDK